MTTTPPPTTHEKYPSIGQLRNFLHEVEYHRLAGPIELQGTVKLHGTHGDVVFSRASDGAVTTVVQSRNRVLTPQDDNMGFAAFMARVPLDLLLARAADAAEADADAEAEAEARGPWERIVVCGEFCGGNIQKSVALSQLPRMFVVFDVEVVRPRGRRVWLGADALARVSLEEHGVHSVLRASPYSFVLDPADPGGAYDALQAVTAAVERECPFAKTFGVSGAGEGVVWRALGHTSSRFWFKVKGEEHRVSRPAPANAGVREQALAVTTENRLRQGVEYLREMGLGAGWKSVGAFVKWVAQDVAKEDGDVVDLVALRKEISNVAREWFKAFVAREGDA